MPITHPGVLSERCGTRRSASVLPAAACWSPAGTGLFFALLPKALRGATQFTGVEYDPVTARIACLIHPEARVRCEDYTRSHLAGGFDLVIGNPPFADRIGKPIEKSRSSASRQNGAYIGSLSIFLP
jgi:hypothetical protein